MTFLAFLMSAFAQLPSRKTSSPRASMGLSYLPMTKLTGLAAANRFASLLVFFWAEAA
jgi:hypothetical protein